jgi:hypothetical protein
MLGIHQGGSAQKVEEPALVDQLVADSKCGISLGRCAALQSNPLALADVPWCIGRLQKHQDSSSYHLLFALRRDHPEKYATVAAEVKAAILCSTLQEFHSGDDWAIGDDPDAPRALFEIGLPALQFLLTLLEDEQELSFSEGGAEPYTVSDLAFDCISKIMGLGFRMEEDNDPQKPRESIQTLKKELVLSPDRRMAAMTLSKINNTLQFWEIPHRWYAGEFSRPVTAQVFSPDGKLLAATVVVWDGRLEAKLGEAPLTAQELDLAWQELADTDSARAWKAVWRLARSPAQALPFLTASLPAVPSIDNARVSRLIQELDDARFTVREHAVKELVALGEEVYPALMAALDGPLSLEVQRRIKLVLQSLENQPVSAEQLRWLRAVHVLEHIGGGYAKQLLSRLAKGTAHVRLVSERWTQLPSGLFRVEKAATID